MEILQIVLSSITTIAALITTFASTIAPIKKARIQADAEIKLKELDLYHSEKARAYKQLTEALGACRHNPTSDDADRIYEAISLASIYSSEKTSKKLMLLVGSRFSPETQNSTDLYFDAMAAMRDELADVLEKPNKIAGRKDSNKKP